MYLYMHIGSNPKSAIAPTSHNFFHAFIDLYLTLTPTYAFILSFVDRETIFAFTAEASLCIMTGSMFTDPWFGPAFVLICA